MASGDEESFVNRYECVCGERWEDVWSCMCNDKCPTCNKEIQPYESEKLVEDEDEDKKYEVIVYFFDMDTDPTTPYEEEKYTIVASSEAQAKHEAIQKAYNESDHTKGVNFSTEAFIN